MKKVLSFAMCLVILASMFTVLNVNTVAANASDIMYVKQSVVKADKITYTVYLNKGMQFTGVINHFKYDPSILSPVSYKVLGDYENSFYDGGVAAAVGSGVYSVSAVMIGDSVWNSSKNGTALMSVTFKVIGEAATKLDMDVYCVEFNSPSASQNINNNLTNPSLIGTLNSSALNVVTMTGAATALGGIQVTWAATRNAAAYRVYKQVNGKWVALANVPAGTTTYLDKTVAHNTTAKYTVRAFDAEKNADSGLGNSVSARYVQVPTLKTALTTNGIKVSWNGISGATQYRVYRRILNSDGTVGDWVLYKAGAKERSYIDKTDLKSNTRYQYLIRSVVSGITSANSKSTAVWYYAAPNVTVSSVEGGAQIKWNKISGASKYRIYRRYKTTDGWTVLKDVPASQTSYIDAKAPAVKKIYYTVKAITPNGNSGYVQKSIGYVKTPILKSATNTASNITVKWEAVKGAQSYIVYRKAGSAKSWTRLGTFKSTSYVDKNVKAGTNYTYTVRACYSKYTSGYDLDGITVRRLAQPALSKVVNNAAGINFTWGKVAGASGYRVYRKTGSSGWTLLGTVKVNSFTDKNVKNGTTYTYTVRAYYGSSLSSYNTKGLSIKCK